MRFYPNIICKQVIGAVLVFFGVGLYGQINEQDCLGAIPICQETFIQPITYTGDGSINNEITTGCLANGEVNGVWYRFTPANSGQIEFLITPGSPSDDYDWAVYDITNFSCNTINTPGALLSCNFSQTTGYTGANNFTNQTTGGALSSPFNRSINVQAGNTYALHVSGFNQSGNGYVLDFRGSNVSIIDQQGPTLSNFDTQVVCGDSLMVLRFSEPIDCSSLDPSDFILSGPTTASINNVIGLGCTNGIRYSDLVEVQLNQPLQNSGDYSISINNQVQDLCGNQSLISNLSFQINGINNNIQVTPSECANSNGAISIQTSGGNGNYSYRWNLGLPNQNNHSNLTPNRYLVETKDDNGCSLQDTIDLEYEFPVEISSQSITPPLCHGDSTGSIEVSITQGNGPFSYAWNVPNSPDSNRIDSLQAGEYSVTVTSSDLCQDTLTIQLSNPPPIRLTSQSNYVICEATDSLIQISNSGGSAPLRYIVNSDTLSGNNFIINSTLDSIYIVEIIDSSGCKSPKDTIHLQTPEPIELTINGDSLICSNESLLLSASVSGGIPNYIYYWGNVSSLTSSVNLPNPGYNSIPIWVEDQCNTFSDTLYHEFDTLASPKAHFDISKPKSCPPLISQAYFPSDTNGLSFQWISDNSLIGTNSSLNWNQNNTGCKSLELRVTNTDGCIDSHTEPCAFEVYPIPNTFFFNTPDTAIFLNPEYTFFDETPDINSRQWTISDGSSYNEEVFTHRFQDTGVYQVELLNFNEYGCSNTFIKNVVVQYLSTIYIPSIFSPNNDGLNDYFRIHINGIKPGSFEVTIYDRWGQNIYSNNDPNFQWDGKTNGNIHKQGVYIVKIEYTTFNDNSQSLIKQVTIIN